MINQPERDECVWLLANPLSKYFACSIARSTADQVQLLPETTEMLRVFYTPYVKDLQEGLKWLVLLFH
jgi:hypothetical protein